tara:strand:+ start:8 stop:2242 length:2235 start_codon:yes stop_codon:yes gene_type:complete
MAEEKPTRDYSPFLANYPIDLLKYPYTDGTDYELNPKPMVSPGQAAWGAAQIIPGMSAPDLAGKMAGPPPKDVKAEDISDYLKDPQSFGGDYMPSYKANVERGGPGGYTDATLQAVGGAADAITYAAPFFGPFSTLPYGLGRTIKGVTTAGQMLKAGANAPKVKSTVKFTSPEAKNKVKKLENEDDSVAALAPEDANRDIETVSERGIISLLNDQEYLQKKKIKYDDPDAKYDVLDVVNRAIDRIPKNNHAAKMHLQRQFDEYLPDDFVNGPPRTMDEIMEVLGQNKPEVLEHVKIDNYNPESIISSGKSTGSKVPYTPIIPAPLAEAPNSILDVYKQIEPVRHGTTSFSIQGGKYGNRTLFQPESHSFVGGFDPMGGRPGTTGAKANTKNRIFHTRYSIYDMPDGKTHYLATESQADIYGLGKGKDMYKATGYDEYSQPRPSVQATIAQENPDLTYRGRMDEVDRPLMAHPLQPDMVDEQIDVFRNRATGFKDTFNESMLDVHQVDHPMQEVIGEYFDELLTNHIPRKDWDEVVKVQDDLHEHWGDIIDDWRRGYREGDVPSYLSDRTAGITTFLENAEQELKALFSKVKLARSPTPMIDDWFPTATKTHFQNAIAEEADVIRFPINDRALATQRTNKSVTPLAARDFNDQLRSFFPPDRIEYTTNQATKDMAKKYKSLTKKSLNVIEQEYGINLNRRVVKDRFDQEFVEVDITPEITEALQTLLLNRGGAVYKKPLMNLRYS